MARARQGLGKGETSRRAAAERRKPRDIEPVGIAGFGDEAERGRGFRFSSIAGVSMAIAQAPAFRATQVCNRDACLLSSR